MKKKFEFLKYFLIVFLIVSIFGLLLFAIEICKYKKLYSKKPLYKTEIAYGIPEQELYLTKENKFVLYVRDYPTLRLEQINPNTGKVEKTKTFGSRHRIISKFDNENKYLLEKNVKNKFNNSTIMHYYAYDFDNDTYEPVNTGDYSIFYLSTPKNNKCLFYKAKGLNKPIESIFEYDFKTRKEKLLLDLTKSKKEYTISRLARYNAKNIILKNSDSENLYFSILNLEDNSFRENVFEFKKEGKRDDIRTEGFIFDNKIIFRKTQSNSYYLGDTKTGKLKPLGQNLYINKLNHNLIVIKNEKGDNYIHDIKANEKYQIKGFETKPFDRCFDIGNGKILATHTKFLFNTCLSNIYVVKTKIIDLKAKKVIAQKTLVGNFFVKHPLDLNDRSFGEPISLLYNPYDIYHVNNTESYINSYGELMLKVNNVTNKTVIAPYLYRFEDTWYKIAVGRNPSLFVKYGKKLFYATHIHNLKHFLDSTSGYIIIQEVE